MADRGSPDINTAFEKTQPHPAHLWGTVESALNVGVRSVINKTSTTEIDNSDVGSVWSD